MLFDLDSKILIQMQIAPHQDFYYQVIYNHHKFTTLRSISDIYRFG